LREKPNVTKRFSREGAKQDRKAHSKIRPTLKTRILKINLKTLILEINHEG
jgi:lantibiotic modifying enzyme